MKKHIFTCMIVVACIVFMISSCDNKKDESDVSDMLINEHETNDDTTAESNQTKAYDINELRSFFEGSNLNENAGFRLNSSVLKFSEVNQTYPVERIEAGGYSIYRVIQGGYFYVFWIDTFPVDINQSNTELSVYFSTYLSGDRSLDLFDSLTPGTSTAKNVKDIDPYFELSFLESNGIYSYSYINDETIVQIKYEYQEGIDGYEDLIVKEKKIVKRDLVSSRYSAILSSDLPS